jgi:predicted TIM-barrel fold metal-dependent hydrolase
MSTSRHAAPPAGPDRTAPLVVFSADAHVAPRMAELRQYCPAEHLAAFDAQAAQHESMGKAYAEKILFSVQSDAPEAQALAAGFERNLSTDAAYGSVDALLHHMDNDGVAAEIFFHGILNGGPMPLISPTGFSIDHTQGADGVTLEQKAAGMQIFNRWCADLVARAPDRLLPAMALPMWDVATAQAELAWCVDHGLRVVSLQAPRPGIPSYDDPAWEPLWSFAEEASVVFATHAGALDMQAAIGTTGPHWSAMLELEAGGWMARRALSRFIFGGVFARHPGLRYILAEQNGDWWSATIREYDSSYRNHRWQLGDQVPEPPSFYLSQNVFIGGSFLASFEAEWAVEQGYWPNLLWGRDFPHIEGTWSLQEEDEASDPARNVTHLAMRNTFSGIPDEPTAGILGGNAVRALGLDGDGLQRIADRINAPTLEELSQPIDAVPENGGGLAFRTVGAWA